MIIDYRDFFEKMVTAINSLGIFCRNQISKSWWNYSWFKCVCVAFQSKSEKPYLTWNNKHQVSSFLAQHTWVVLNEIDVIVSSLLVAQVTGVSKTFIKQPSPMVLTFNLNCLIKAIDMSGHTVCFQWLTNNEVMLKSIFHTL